MSRRVYVFDLITLRMSLKHLVFEGRQRQQQRFMRTFIVHRTALTVDGYNRRDQKQRPITSGNGGTQERNKTKQKIGKYTVRQKKSDDDVLPSR